MSSVAGPHPHSGIGTAAAVAGQAGAVREREVIAAAARGLSTPAQAVLGAASMGAVDEKTIMEYIENQKWEEGAEAFKITALAEP